MDETYRELCCLALRWVLHDEIDPSIRFNPIHSSINEADESYDAAPLSSIVSAHHILKSNYSVLPFCPKIRWAALIFNVDRIHQQSVSQRKALLPINSYVAQNKNETKPDFNCNYKLVVHETFNRITITAFTGNDW